MKRYLAFDLGAESGRAMLGALDGGRLTLEELHRFANQPVRLPGGLYWDIFRLFHDIVEGLRVAGRDRKLSLDGVAVDTWGVDLGFVGADGSLVDNPRHYRDARTQGEEARVFEKVPKDQVFAATGIQFMELNSLIQWHAAARLETPGLAVAKRLLFVPDLLSYWLSGVQANELTIASTSQFYDPAGRRWATGLLEKLGLDARLLGEIVLPGYRLGSLLPHLQDHTGLGEVPVYATASHDTASAVAAVPASGSEPWCYISSGTWSLMGVELPEPIVTPDALALNYTNEVGAEGKVRLLKNIAGLWVVQELRRAWKLEGTGYSYEQLARMAGDARPFQAVISPDDFLEPGHMPERIATYCQKTGQAVPDGPGAMVRTVLESLALRYRQVLAGLESLIGKRIETIHIVGGGSKNTLLNQFVADASGRKVVAGPTEATAAGNILVQAMGGGVVKNLAEVRQVVRASFPLETYTPKPAPEWERAFGLFEKLTATSLQQHAS